MNAQRPMNPDGIWTKRLRLRDDSFAKRVFPLLLLTLPVGVAVCFLTFALLSFAIPFFIFLPGTLYAGICHYWLRNYGQNGIFELLLAQTAVLMFLFIFDIMHYYPFMGDGSFSLILTLAGLYNMVFFILWIAILTYRRDLESRRVKAAALARMRAVPASGAARDALHRLSADILVLHANAPETRRHIERCVANARLFRSYRAGVPTLPGDLRYGRIEVFMDGERVIVDDVFFPPRPESGAEVFLRFTETDFADFVSTVRGMPGE